LEARYLSSVSITKFPLPEPNPEPLGITAGPDGNLWFAELQATGRFTPDGQATRFTEGLSAGAAARDNR
jgi:virginiamycin B lyase